MPELPDVVVVVERLADLLRGHRLTGIRLASPFLLRTVAPPLSSATGKQVESTQRLGKRVVIGLEGELFLVVHLMIAGRLQWKPLSAAQGPAKIPGKIGVAAFDFDHGTLTFTEASPKKRASLHLVQGQDALADHDPGGVDVFSVSDADFAALLRAERHTLKRVLTDPRTFSGIGNAYSDEILHHARLSPVAQSTSLSDDDAQTLLSSTREVLRRFTDLLRADHTTPLGPEKMTAFRPEMAAHGKAGQPCPRCGAPIQRIAYADNETNYCAPCQTGGKLLADRALSRLLKDDFPRTLDDLEALKREHKQKASSITVPLTLPSSSSEPVTPQQPTLSEQKRKATKSGEIVPPKPKKPRAPKKKLELETATAPKKRETTTTKHKPPSTLN